MASRAWGYLCLMDQFAKNHVRASHLSRRPIRAERNWEYMADENAGEPGASEGAATYADRANIAVMARNVASVAAIP